MKILAIRGKNLASLEGAFEVDFTQEPLLSAGIFAITGPTGSGKSSLLDAMCLALFGKTPRLLRANENGVTLQDGQNGNLGLGDVRNILRKGTAEGFAEVDFLGQDEVNYRATWSVNRSYNKPDGKLQSDSVQLKNLNLDKKLGENKTATLQEIERLIGLNFDQFTRSVLLAQGDFTAFLKANRSEKAALLEKLTGTDIYSTISIEIYNRCREARGEWAAVVTQWEGINLLKEDELAVLQTQKEQVEGELKSLIKQLKAFEAAYQWYQKQDELLGKAKEAEAAYEQVQTTYEAAADRRQQMELTDQVQDARQHHESKISCLKIQQEKECRRVEAEKRILELQESIGQKRVKQQQAQEALLAARKAYEEARPLIAQANQLDGLLTDKGKELLPARERASAASKAYEDALRELKEKEQQDAELTAKIKELSQWKQQNEKGEVIARNINSITEKLEECAQTLTSRQSVTAVMRAQEQKLELNTVNEQRLEETLEELEKAVLEEKSLLQRQLEEKKSYAIEEMQTRKERSEDRLRQLNLAKESWKTFQEVLTQKEKCAKAILDACQALEQNSSQLEEVRQQLKEAGIKKEQSERLYNAAVLKTTESTEELRSQLKEGEDCPVCGSTTHPYVHQQEGVFHNILQELQKEVAECKQCHENLLATSSSLNQVVCSLQQTVEERKKEKEELDKREQKIGEEWRRLPLYVECSAVQDRARFSWLEVEQLKLETALAELKEKEKHYQQLSQQIETQRFKVDDCNQKAQQKREELQSLRSAGSLLKQQIQQAKEKVEELEKKLYENKNTLSVYSSREWWFEEWQTNPESYLKVVKSFASRWEEKTSFLTENVTRQGIIQTQLTGLKAQQADLQERKKEATHRLNELQGEIQQLQVSRTSLFEGKAVTIVEEEFAVLQQQLEGALKACNREVEEVNTSLNNATGTLETIMADIQENEENLKNCIQKLAKWIQDFNSSSGSAITEDEVKVLFSLSPDWLRKERQELTALERALNEKEQAFKLQKRQLLEHLEVEIIEVKRSEVEEKLQVARNAQELKGKEREELSYKLRLDEENKRKSEHLQKELAKKERVREQWEKLNELLGSASGDKFRLVAQEYTLEILLNYANIHLQELNPRYRLKRIPDSLALQVMDDDMAGEIRSVHSLSGGESFLVSLALALGLASLSSNRMRVESLFIDEGFGSLDPDTLRVAMDALEHLHNQGRKVGVISHVQEMTERIQTQIAVTRVAGGKSKVIVRQ